MATVKPVVGTLVTYHNKEKGTTKEYEITGSIPDFLLLRDTVTGKGHKLRVGSKIYTDMFGGAEPESQEPQPEPKKEPKAEKPKDASETVDMSKYVETEKPQPKKESAPESKKPEPKKEPKAEKPKDKPQPEPEPEGNTSDGLFDSVDYDDENAGEGVLAVAFMMWADSKSKLSEFLAYLSSDDAEVRKMTMLYAFAWLNRGKMNIDREALAEAVSSTKRKKPLAEFTNSDVKKLGDAILASTNGDWDLSELVKLFPEEDNFTTIICQLICDGGISDWGHNLKGIKDDVLSKYLAIIWEIY